MSKPANMKHEEKRTALPKEVVHHLEDVLGYFGEKKREKAKEDPEAYLISLLRGIRKELPVPSATLKLTIEFATFDESAKGIREELNRSRETEVKEVTLTTRRGRQQPAVSRH